jgi:hypothetical protein
MPLSCSEGSRRPRPTPRSLGAVETQEVFKTVLLCQQLLDLQATQLLVKTRAATICLKVGGLGCLLRAQNKTPPPDADGRRRKTAPPRTHHGAASHAQHIKFRHSLGTTTTSSLTVARFVTPITEVRVMARQTFASNVPNCHAFFDAVSSARNRPKLVRCSLRVGVTVWTSRWTGVKCG